MNTKKRAKSGTVGTLDTLQVMLSKQNQKVGKLMVELRDAMWARNALMDTLKKLKK